MKRHLLFTVLLSLVGCMIISWPLWLNERALPVVPVIDLLVFSNPVQLFILFLFGIFCCLSLFEKTRKVALPGVILILLLFCMQDQIRWQPWVFIFGILLLVLSLDGYKSRVKDLKSLFQIALIGIYFWSGIHKINIGFVLEYFPNWSGFDSQILGYLTGILEAGIGLCLISRRTRRWAVVGLSVMHIFIMAKVLFSSMFFDLVILPWNLGMMVLLWILFRDFEFVSIGSLKPIKTAVIILFLILPGANFIGLWPHYFSFSLFSGKHDKAWLYVDEPIKESFSPESRELFDWEEKIFAQGLSYSELNAPLPPEKALFTSLFYELCDYAEHELSLILVVRTLPDLFKDEWVAETYFCEDVSSD